MSTKYQTPAKKRRKQPQEAREVVIYCTILAIVFYAIAFTVYNQLHSIASYLGSRIHNNHKFKDNQLQWIFLIYQDNQI